MNEGGHFLPSYRQNLPGRLLFFFRVAPSVRGLFLPAIAPSPACVGIRLLVFLSRAIKRLVHLFLDTNRKQNFDLSLLRAKRELVES